MDDSFKYRKNPIRKYFPGLLAAFAAFLVFFETRNFAFIGWDDPFVYDNPSIRSLDLEFFKWVFTTPVANNWHPLTFITFAVDYALWGLDPSGYHLVNTIIHSLNAFLVFILASRLLTLHMKASGGDGAGGAALAAFCAAFFFGVHPLRAESVAWVSERKDVLYAFFYLLSMIAYLSYAERRSKASYAAAFALFVLSLLSKPMAITLPVVLLILDYYPLNRLDSLKSLPRRVLEKAPFFLLSVLIIPVTIWAQAGLVKPIEAVPVYGRLVTASRGYAFYLYKTFIPEGLAPFYPLPMKAGYFSAEYVALALVFPAFCVIGFIALRRHKAFNAVWLYYVVTLIPVIGLVQVGIQSAADRYTYITTLGPVLLAASLAARIWDSWKAAKAAMTLAGVLAAVLLAYAGTRQVAAWQNSLTLLNRQVEVYPNPLAYINRGIARDEAGDGAGAISDYSEAIRLDPKYARAYATRAGALLREGNVAGAIDDYGWAIRLEPEDPSSYLGMGMAYLKAGSESAALFNIRIAARLGSKEAEGLLLRAAGQ